MTHFDPEWRDKVKEQTRSLSPEALKKIEDQKAQAAEIKSLFVRVAETPDGQALFRHLCKFLGYKQSTLTLKSNGETAFDLMVMKETQRNVWIELRKNFPLHLRNLIEEDTDVS